MRDLGSTEDWGYADDAGRLAAVSVNGTPQADYLYNALGQQVSRAVGSGPSAVVTLSVHDLAGNRIAEHDDTGAVLREYIWLDGRPPKLGVAVVEGGQTYQLHWDHIMRPVMATDAAGPAVLRRMISPTPVPGRRQLVRRDLAKRGDGATIGSKRAIWEGSC